MKSIAFVVSFLIATTAQAELCQRWSSPTNIGQLNVNMITEASGVEVSAAFPNRLYWNNDRGDGPYFYQTNMDGSGTRRITIANWNVEDAEDIALGPCGNGKTCVAVGDTGDNDLARREIKVALIEEVANFPNRVQPMHVLRLRYPDGRHNAEAMVLHPNGDLYILTKEFEFLEDEENDEAGVARSARLYRFPKSQFPAAAGVAGVLEFVGEIDLPFFNRAFESMEQIATGMDIASDGSRILVVTYANAIEFNFDIAGAVPAANEMREGVDYKLITLRHLPKQETISYLPGDRSFIYSTEAESAGSPILRVNCAE